MVEYYGEKARTLPPTTFFSLFARYIKAFKVSDSFTLLYTTTQLAVSVVAVPLVFLTQLPGLGGLQPMFHFITGNWSTRVSRPGTMARQCIQC